MGVAGVRWHVAAVGGAALVADGEGDALVLGVEPLGPSHVQWHGLAAQDEGDDPGLTREAAGGGGADPVAVAEGGDSEAGVECLEVEGDHHGGVHASGLGELVGGVALDQLPERLPEPLRGGSPLAGLGVLEVVVVMPRGVGDRVERELECGALVGGECEAAPGLAVAVVVELEERGRLGVLGLALEDLLLEGLAQLGGDDVEDVLADPAQHLGVVVGRDLQQVVAGLGTDADIDVADLSVGVSRSRRGSRPPPRR